MSLLIDNILRKFKITDYLESKHIYPEGGERNGKLFYKCPLHQGDNTPSFVVYTNGEFENFYCYGCKAKYHIIHLYRDLEHVTLKDAIAAMSDGIVPTDDAELTHAVAEAQTDTSLQARYIPEEIALLIARQLYDFQKMVEFDSECLKSCDAIFIKVEAATLEGDIDALMKIDTILQDVLPQKVAVFLEEKEQKMSMLECDRSQSPVKPF
jgi:hypothetical protein